MKLSTCASIAAALGVNGLPLPAQSMTLQIRQLKTTTLHVGVHAFMNVQVRVSMRVS